MNGLKLWDDEENTMQITAKCIFNLCNIDTVLIMKLIG